MWKKIIVCAGTGLGTALVTLVGVAVHKLNKLNRKFDRSVNELEEATVKDIQKTVVQEAVNRAAKNTVDDYMRDVHDVVLSDARRELQKEASSAVAEAKKDIQSKVSDTISEEAAKLDMSELRREVRAKAEEKILDKFDDNLQDVVDKFSDNLSSVHKIYSSIADTMKRNSDKDDNKGVRLTLG